MGPRRGERGGHSRTLFRSWIGFQRGKRKIGDRTENECKGIGRKRKGEEGKEDRGKRRSRALFIFFFILGTGYLIYYYCKIIFILITRRVQCGTN